MSARGSEAILLGAVLLATAWSGCLGGGDERLDPASTGPAPMSLVHEQVGEGLQALAGERAEPLTLQTNVTVNVVFVGLDGSLVETDQLQEELPDRYSPRIDFSKPRSQGLRSGLEQGIDYAFHQAPDTFADQLFERYPEWSTTEELSSRVGAGPSFLERYDRMYDLGRAEAGTEEVVDAEKVEAWLHEHRGEHGLDFEEPELTVFFLDSWTNHGLFEDTYYRYAFENNTVGGSDARNMRAFGGTYDFLFMDYAAAPNDALFDNSGLADIPTFQGATSFPVIAPEGTAYNDPPMWHYDGATATIGQGPYEKTVHLTDRIEHALDIAVNVRALGTYAYRPVYEDRYHINMHLFHDGRSTMPTDGLEDLLDREAVVGALQEEIPWANVTGSIDTYVLPEDDPGMAQALDTAKAQAGGTYVPTKPVVDQVNAHEDQYVAQDEDAFQVTALLFLLEGHYAFVLPVIVGGVALGSADGDAWGTISSVNDYSYLGNGQDMDAMAASLERINAHEVGHFFGLMHAHEGSRPTASGYEYVVDHTWSSTRTIMSYRLEPFTSDLFHLEHLARAHTLENLQQTLRNTQSAYRALDAAGVETTPEDVASSLDGASDAVQTARERLHEGAPLAAVEAAIDARRASESALQAAEVEERTVRVAAWSNEGVHSVAADYDVLTSEATVVPTGVRFDLQPIELTEDAQEVTVRATWTNAPESWGDFFLAWTTDPVEPVVNVGPVPYGSPVSLSGGIHDPAEEGPMDGEVERSFTLDLDRFPNLRELGTIYAGAGTQGNAVDGGYEVEILVTYRDHGDATTPDPVEGVQEDAGELVERSVRVHGLGASPPSSGHPVPAEDLTPRPGPAARTPALPS